MSTDDVELDLDDARTLCVDLLREAGVSEADAGCVADHLVEATAMGIESHGIIRIGQYLDDLAAARVEAGAVPFIEISGALIRIDGRRALGQVAAAMAVDAATTRLGEKHTAVVCLRNCGHVGRLGAYTERLANAGALALAFASAPIDGHWVAPYGARSGRMATNPLSWAMPGLTRSVVADFATSAITEGQVRMLHRSDRPAPEHALCDAEGRPTTDSAVLYSMPRGFILPLGGDIHGHRGSALGLLVEMMATTLAGDVPDDPARIGNNLTLMAIAVDRDFPRRAEELARYVRSAPPRFENGSVMMPGDPEADAMARSASVRVDSLAWEDIVARANRAGVKVPVPLEERGNGSSGSVSVP